MLTDFLDSTMFFCSILSGLFQGILILLKAFASNPLLLGLLVFSLISSVLKKHF